MKTIWLETLVFLKVEKADVLERGMDSVGRKRKLWLRLRHISVTVFLMLGIDKVGESHQIVDYNAR